MVKTVGLSWWRQWSGQVVDRMLMDIPSCLHGVVPAENAYPRMRNSSFHPKRHSAAAGTFHSQPDNTQILSSLFSSLFSM